MFRLFRRSRAPLAAAALLTAAAAIGMGDSFYLTLQYLAALAHPGEATPCTVNTLVSCTKTVQGEWAHFFPGIPNPMLGMLWYSGFTAYGATRLLGAAHSRRARALVGAVLLLGLAFSYRLYLASLFELRGVCPFCLTSTAASTLILLAFGVDDASYPDPLLARAGRKLLFSLQALTTLFFVVGLPWFLWWGLSLMPNPAEAMAHWSFPVMLILVAVMASAQVWAYLSLRKR